MNPISKERTPEPQMLGAALDRFYEDFLGFRFPDLFGAQRMDLDMYPQDDALVIQVSLSNCQPGNVKVSLDGSQLTFSGEIRQQRKADPNTRLLRERQSGRFERRVTLPFAVDTNQVNVTCQESILTIRLPRDAIRSGMAIPIIS